MKATATDGRVCPRRIRCLFLVLSRRSYGRYAVQPAHLVEVATDDAIAPEIWAFEIANIIFVAFHRRKRINQKQIDEYLMDDLRKAAQSEGIGVVS